MKNKRIIVVFILTFLFFGSITAMAASVYKTYVYNSTSSIAAYIDFLEGPLTIADKVYYSVDLTGSDISRCTVAYSVIVDNSQVASGVLNSSNPRVSESGLSVGYGHEYAKLQLDFNGKTKILTSFAD